MDILGQKQDQSQVTTLVQQAVSETNPYKKVRMCHTINHAFSAQDKKHKELHKYLDKMLTDTNFMRKLKLNSTIKGNDLTAIEYYGKDYLGGDENLMFDQDFEDILTEIENRIDEYLGYVLIELNKGGDDISLEI
jgi:hypothetical protein